MQAIMRIPMPEQVSGAEGGAISTSQSREGPGARRLHDAVGPASGSARNLGTTHSTYASFPNINEPSRSLEHFGSNQFTRLRYMVASSHEPRVSGMAIMEMGVGKTNPPASLLGAATSPL